MRKTLMLAFCALVALGAIPADPQTDTSVFNVAQFGAKGDGVADDTPAFEAALHAAVSDGGGVIYAPHTRAFYRLSGCPALRFATNVPIKLRGDGRFLTVLKTSEQACGLIEVEQSRFTVSGFTLDCVTQCTSGDALSFRSGSFVDGSNLWFGNRTFSDIAIGARDLQRGSSDKVTLDDVDGHIAHAGGTGIEIATGYSDIELNAVRLNCNESGRRAVSAYGLHASGSFDTLTMNYVYLQDCGYGIAFTPADGAVIEDVTGGNVILDGMEHVALLMRPSGPLGTGMVLRVLLNSLWAGAQGAPGGSHAAGIVLDGGPLRTGIDGVRVSDFTIPLAQTYGITLDRGNDPTFPMHAIFAEGTITGWSRAAPGTYPAIAIGLTAPVDDVDVRTVEIGAWAHVGSAVPAPLYRIYPGSKHVRI